MRKSVFNERCAELLENDSPGLRDYHGLHKKIEGKLEDIKHLLGAHREWAEARHKLKGDVDECHVKDLRRITKDLDRLISHLVAEASGTEKQTQPTEKE